jgi:UDP:flavonoid glycosyltransferase YjiC (YdhE family)
MKTRVLFFGEPVTLAHVARPLVLARALDPDLFDVAVATGPAFRPFVDAEALPFRALHSVGSAFFLAAVARGQPVFPFAELARYVDDDLEHIREWRPDVVVGDFRISLQVSARLAGVPYVAVTNAYWSPYAQPRFDIPVHPASRLLGPAVAGTMFRAARPVIFAQHSLPMLRLRRKHAMPSIGLDLRRVFTEADVTLFADASELVPGAVPDTKEAAGADYARGRYRYIGPVYWSPRLPLPEEFHDDAAARPLVYVTLGSSGDARLLSAVLAGLAALDCRVAVATAGVVAATAMPANVFAAEFLPGDLITAKSSLVVCNGGSLTCQQAIACGVPVLGIPANLDQLLNMHYMVRAGVGMSIRPEALRAQTVRAAAKEMLERDAFRHAASRLATVMSRYDAGSSLAQTVTALRSR